MLSSDFVSESWKQKMLNLKLETTKFNNLRYQRPQKNAIKVIKCFTWPHPLLDYLTVFRLEGRTYSVIFAETDCCHNKDISAATHKLVIMIVAKIAEQTDHNKLS